MNKKPNYQIIFLSVFFLIFFQAIDIKAQNDIAQKGDSLFSAKKYSEAAKIYEVLSNDNSINKENLNLKLAFIYENLADFPRALYYLSNYYNLKPSDEVFEKMNKIALENKYGGFERNDVNFILMLYQQYFVFILYILISIGIVILVIFYRKKQTHQKINKRHLWIMGFFLIVLLVLINVPSSYKSAIVSQKAYLRGFPSGASPITGNISEGNKINIFGQQDIWLRTIHNNKVAFVNKNDVWLIQD
ncbi:MAG: hypothetical protein IPH28_17900 [Cytophagaceae bacterium]|nr:hypothetical protein [Cytophagaceae bacterium]MBK9936151.1 hypothetical protein [Cytophagaceae bacterium]MBL0303962.1 hypothetical protein [Cytophagaceae bacterium]MBL0326775.1 hypothetical protein [Cytophagaceae bacterium]